MDYETTIQSTRGRNVLNIDIDGEEVEIEGLAVEQYYYERSDRYGDDLMLLTDDDEVQIDLDEGAIRRRFGYGEVTISLPEELIDEIKRKLENSVTEWSA